jgi:hypothetical protein
MFYIMVYGETTIKFDLCCALRDDECFLHTFTVYHLHVPNAVDAQRCSDKSAIGKDVSVVASVDGHDTKFIFVQAQLRIG